MATVKVLIKGEELKEKDDVSKVIKNLKKYEQERLKGFFQGLAFYKNNKE